MLLKYCTAGLVNNKVLKEENKDEEKLGEVWNVWKRELVRMTERNRNKCRKWKKMGEGQKTVELAICWEQESHDKYIEQLME